jgi:hypothetical protein
VNGINEGQNGAAGIGVQGLSRGAEGVFGQSESLEKAGVAGVNVSGNGGGAGVFGETTTAGAGVFGRGLDGAEGVRSVTESPLASAVVGSNLNGPNDDAGAGVFGVTDTAGAGVFGKNQNPVVLGLV